MVVPKSTNIGTIVSEQMANNTLTEGDMAASRSVSARITSHILSEHTLDVLMVKLRNWEKRKFTQGKRGGGSGVWKPFR